MFKDKLKELRKERGLTQKQVAQAINVVESCYANWEQGRAEPSIAMIIVLCKFLSTTPNELFEFE